MRKWYYGGLVALACLALAGCAEQPAPVNPAGTLALLRAGRPLLTCHEACLAQWRAAQPQAAQLEGGAHWQNLATLLAGIGYQDDLSLYYLGQAAEGLGDRAAAVGYYRQSTAVSGTSGSCERLSRVCGGVVLPRAAVLRIAAIERELTRGRARRPGPAPQAAETTAATPEPETPAATPEEAATPATPAPSPIASPAGPPASEYIEPPPAVR
jgi:hypothetical protein